MNLSDEDARRILDGLARDAAEQRAKNRTALLLHERERADICHVWFTDVRVFTYFERGRCPGNDGLIVTLPDTFGYGGGVKWMEI